MSVSAARLQLLARRLQQIARAYATTPRQMIADSDDPDRIALAIGCPPAELRRVVELTEQTSNGDRIAGHWRGADEHG